MEFALSLNHEYWMMFTHLDIQTAPAPPVNIIQYKGFKTLYEWIKLARKTAVTFILGSETLSSGALKSSVV